MGRHANPDIRRAFAEFHDSDSTSKCLKVRCIHCGYVRAKNTTRQIEHLQECALYLDSSDARAHMSANEESIPPETTRNMLNGTQPNPNLQIHRRGPNQKRRDPILVPAPSRTTPLQTGAQPSLAQHLVTKNQLLFNSATQQPFLQQAGNGTLSSLALTAWMVQDNHYTRGYMQFIGALIGKIKLPYTSDIQFHPMYRTLDLLISALNNIRREMSFFEVTATKYGIMLNDDPPNYITRAYLDLFMSVSAPSASLLEGLVVLWATEHCYRTAWMYASNQQPSIPLSSEPHIAALHQSLIPNWTSQAFCKFVDACRGLVDELAISPTIADGKEEMMRCEQVFRQVCYLSERFWPSDLDGMDTDGLGQQSASVGTLSALQSGAVQAARAANEVVQGNSFAHLGADHHH